MPPDDIYDDVLVGTQQIQIKPMKPKHKQLFMLILVMALSPFLNARMINLKSGKEFISVKSDVVKLLKNNNDAIDIYIDTHIIRIKPDDDGFDMKFIKDLGHAEITQAAYFAILSIIEGAKEIDTATGQGKDELMKFLKGSVDKDNIAALRAHFMSEYISRGPAPRIDCEKIEIIYYGEAKPQK
jgi:hypothetical protein